MAISRMQEPRQLYGLGSLVKKITRPIKKIVKSPIGKAGLLALGAYGLGGGFGAGGFKFGNILGKAGMMRPGQGFGGGKGLLGLFSKAKNALSGSKLFSGLASKKGLLGIGAASGLLGGLLAKGEDETEEEYQDRIVRLQPYLKQYYSNVGDTFGDQQLGPNELEDFVTSQSIEYQGAKDGGLMGYESGGYVGSRKNETLKDEYDSYIKEMDIEGEKPMSFRSFKKMLASDLKEGGIVSAGGVTPEEMKKIKKSAEYKGWKRMYDMNADAAAEHPRHSEFLNVLKRVKKAEGGEVKSPAPMDFDMEEEVVEQDDMSEPMTGIEKVADSLRDIAMVLYKVNPTIMPYKMAKAMYDRLPDISKQHVDDTGRRMTEPEEDEVSETMIMVEGKKDGGIMNLGGKEMDLRGGGFVPLGKKERADDVPARLSKNEFVFTADAVRAAGGGSVKKGAQKMYDTMKMLENRIR
jgi:hypothetical protein